MAIVKSERFPALNPIRFTPMNDTLAANINTWSFDRGLFCEQLRQWEYGSIYQQKYNYGDQLTIFLDSLATGIGFYVLDEEGNVLAGPAYTGTGISGIALPGNVYTHGGIDYPYNSRMVSCTLANLYTLVPSQQILHIAIECIYVAAGDADSRWYVSEPLFFRKSGWPKTMLVTATHFTNRYDVLFEIFNSVFHYRVEANISHDPQPAFKDTVFEDQGYEMVVLDSNPYRLFDFLVGGLKGVPKYMLDKINRALCLNSFTIDGVPYAKDNGAAWSMVNAPEYRMHGAKIRLQEQEHDSGTVYDSPDEVALDRVHTMPHSLVYA